MGVWLVTEGWDSVGPDPADAELKQEIMDMILWADRNSPRSKQLAIGPSEVGDPCDRRIAYKLAGTPEINTYRDPWPAIVGTAIHAWLENGIQRYQDYHLGPDYHYPWLTELAVSPDPLVEGHSDVYNQNTQSVVDWKTCGVDAMRKYRKEVPQGYRVQIQLYGLGHENAGRPVKDVILVFFPRSGWLGDMFIHREPYDRSVAEAALERMYSIGGQCLDLDVENEPQRFQDIEATPGDSCVWCPLFNKNLGPDICASDQGCPGR